VVQYEASFIACADTPLGRAVVASINNIYPPVHARVKEALTRWLTEKETQAYYGVYQKYFFEAKPLP